MKPEFSIFKRFCTPAFSGITELLIFWTVIFFKKQGKGWKGHRCGKMTQQLIKIKKIFVNLRVLVRLWQKTEAKVQKKLKKAGFLKLGLRWDEKPSGRL